MRHKNRPALDPPPPPPPRGFFCRYGVAILVVVGLLVPGIYLGSIRTMESNRNEVKSWLPATYEETTTFNWYWDHFEGDAFIVASWEGCTLGSRELGQFVRTIRAEIYMADRAERPFFFRDVTSGRELLDRLTRVEGLSREGALNRLRGAVIGPDSQQTCAILSFSSQAMRIVANINDSGANQQRKFFHEAVEHVYRTAESCGIPREQLHLGGPPVDNVAIDVEGERSLMKLSAACGILGLVLSWWSLRSWGLTLTVFTTALFSAGVSLTLVWLTGATMNALLLTMPALVFVAGVSGAIHLANYYHDAVTSGGVANAADRAVAESWIPLGLATGTTSIGLLSLAISELTPIRMFGIYSSLGVVGAFVMLCVYMPSVLEVFVVILAGMAFCTYGVTKVETSVKLMRLFSPNARIIQDYAWLEDRIGALVPVEVVLRVDNKTSGLDLLEQMRLVGDVQRAIGRMGEVGSTLGAPTLAPSIPRHPGAVRRAAWNSLLNRHRDTLGDYWSYEQNDELWRISARVGALNDLDYEEFLTDLRAVVEPVLQSYRDRGVQGVSATYTGIVPLIYKAQHSLLNNFILGFAGDLILIGIAIVVLMRNLSSGILLMLASIFPLAVVFGTMGWAGVVVDTGTVMTPAVALGVTVDDAIHFMLWCRRGQRRGMNRTESIMFAYGDCARAIYQSWAVIGLGLSAFALSSFIPTRRFGILMFTMLTVSSIGNLVFLPALLAGPAGRWFWRIRPKKLGRQPLSTIMDNLSVPSSEAGVATSHDDKSLVYVDDAGTGHGGPKPHILGRTGDREAHSGLPAGAGQPPHCARQVPRRPADA